MEKLTTDELMAIECMVTTRADKDAWEAGNKMGNQILEKLGTNIWLGSVSHAEYAYGEIG